RDALELLLELVARRGELRELVLGLLDPALGRLDLVLQVLDAALRLTVDPLPLGPQVLAVVDRALDLVRRSAVMERVVGLEAQLLQPAVDEGAVRFLAQVLLLRELPLAPQVGDAARRLARRRVPLRIRERLRGRLVRRIRVEPRLLRPDRLLELRHLEPVE